MLYIPGTSSFKLYVGRNILKHEIHFHIFKTLQIFIMERLRAHVWQLTSELVMGPRESQNEAFMVKLTDQLFNTRMCNFLYYHPFPVSSYSPIGTIWQGSPAPDVTWAALCAATNSVSAHTLLRDYVKPRKCHPGSHLSYQCHWVTTK